MEHYKFFQNKECEFFPCHKTGNPDTFNCLFCFCPLYHKEEACGGNYTILPNGIKDCSNCLIPHAANGYEHVINRLRNHSYGVVTKDCVRKFEEFPNK